MTDVTLYAIPAFIGTLLLEGVLLRKQGHPYEVKDTLASLSGGLGSLVSKALVGGAIGVVQGWLYTHRVASIGSGWAMWLTLPFAEDLAYYCFHRTCHGMRFFWATHVVHHSSQRYTLATALRQSWTSPLFGAVFWMPLPLLGYRPELIALMSGISLLYQYWLHTELIGKLGPFEWIMNTPSHHRVHHGSDEKYLDRNHAGIFILWDRLFGTFQAEEETPTYGLTKNVKTFNPVKIQLLEFQDMLRDVLHAKSWRERLLAVIASPAFLAKHRAIPS